jgi:hypothetical protein
MLSKKHILLVEVVKLIMYEKQYKIKYANMFLSLEYYMLFLLDANSVRRHILIKYTVILRVLKQHSAILYKKR